MKNDAYFQYEMLDIALTPFMSAAGGGISRSILFGSGELPPHYDETLSRLVREGFLEENTYGYKITHKGRTMMEEGGFLRKYRREMRNHRLAVLGVLAAVISALLALIALYLQYCR